MFGIFHSWLSELWFFWSSVSLISLGMGDLLLGRNPELISGLVGGEYQSEATLAGGCRERIRGGAGGLGVGEGPDGGGLGVGDGPGGLIIKYYIVKVQLHKKTFKKCIISSGGGGTIIAIH